MSTNVIACQQELLHQLLHYPAQGAAGRSIRVAQTPLDEVKKGLHGDAGAQHMNNLVEADSGLFSCNGKLGEGLCEGWLFHVPHLFDA